MPHETRARSEYNTAMPGDNAWDEARRAASDLCRLTRMWVLIAEANEEALNPAFAKVYDDNGGDEALAPRPSRLINPATRREDLRREVRAHWPIWSAGVERFKVALLKVVDSDIDAAKLAARRGMMELTRIFFAPIILVHDEQPGDQLLGAGGPMHCKVGGRSAIHRHEIAKLLEPIADFSDLMATYDVQAADLGSDDGANGAGGSDEPDLRERRSAEWFAKVTDGALYPDLLRIAQNRGRLQFSRKHGYYWHYSIDEICHKHPEYAAKIRAQVAREAAKA